jgi:hypothetical protein
VDFIKVGHTVQSEKRTQFWEKMQQVWHEAQIHDTKLGKMMGAERKFQA